MTQAKKNGWKKKLLTIALVIAAAWLLGQMAVPALLKAVFL